MNFTEFDRPLLLICDELDPFDQLEYTFLFKLVLFLLYFFFELSVAYHSNVYIEMGYFFVFSKRKWFSFFS